MTDYELNTLIKTLVDTGLTAKAITDVQVRRGQLPVNVGVSTGKMIAFFKIADHRYGTKHVSSQWNELTSEFIETTTQQYESTFQMEALIPTVAASTQTASDLANIAAEIMQSTATLAALTTAGVGIYKIADVRNPNFSDDRNRNEQSPSFDFTLTHKQITTRIVPTAQSVESGFYRV